MKSIISSGKINHIINDQLVILISEFEDHVYDATESDITQIELMENQIHPLIRQYIPLNTKSRRENYTPWSNTPSSRFPANYEGLFSDQILESAIVAWCGWREVTIQEQEELLSTMDAMIEIIDGELGK